MTQTKSPVSHKLITLWNRLNAFPGGLWLFNRILSWQVPYTGSIKSQVLELKPGYCKVKLRDRRSVRNHLNSIHAVALVNLGEQTSGLAMLAGLAPNVRGIVINISIEYLKKARGTLIAECHSDIPEVTDDTEFQVLANIVDQDQDIVARTTVTWRLGLIQ